MAQDLVPAIATGETLGTTAATVQWIVSGYALAFGLTLVTGGRLGDAYGRRRMMLIGLTGFIVSSAAVGLAAPARVAVAAGYLPMRDVGAVLALVDSVCARLYTLVWRQRPRRA